MKACLFIYLSAGKINQFPGDNQSILALIGPSEILPDKVIKNYEIQILIEADYKKWWAAGQQLFV